MSNVFCTIGEIETFFATLTVKKKDYPPFFMMRKALKLLDYPQDCLQYVHIAGTNGKGSTSHYISQLLVAHGVQVGLFTSPHIFQINERIKCNNEAISDAVFIKMFNDIFECLHQQCDLIQFEWLTLLALKVFQQQQPDIVIMESGIGGLWDTTNIIPHKIAAVITSIGHDHHQLLGDTLESIGRQKVGIVTEKTKYVFLGANTSPFVSEHLKSESFKNIMSKTYGTDFHYNSQKKCFILSEGSLVFTDTTLPMYQYENMALALEVSTTLLQLWNIEIHKAILVTALRQLTLPIRFEIIQRDEQLFIFDGAHNTSGIEAFLDTLDQMYPHKKYEFIFAAMRDKSYSDMVNLLTTKGTVMFFDYAAIYDRAVSTRDLADAWPDHLIFEDISKITKYMRRNFDPERVLIFVGSIYFVSYMREHFDEMMTKR